MGSVSGIRAHHFNAHGGEALKAMFRSGTDRARGLTGVCSAVCEVVRFVVSREGKFTFVSGLISADGPQFIDRNMAVLTDFTDHIRKDSTAPVMSATDVFHRSLLDLYRTESRDGWAVFWRKVLRSGISTLIMTPRWEDSYGAKDEHGFALQTGIQIEYRQYSPELLEILKSHGVEYKRDEEKIRKIVALCLRFEA